jgi:hypothetical protein
MGSGGITLPFLASALDGIEWPASHITFGERDAGTHCKEAGWTPEPVWTLWNGEKDVALAGNRTLAVHSVAYGIQILTKNGWPGRGSLGCSHYVGRFLKFEVLRPVDIKSSTFWDNTPCSPLKVYWGFGGTCRLHLQAWVSQGTAQ